MRGLQIDEQVLDPRLDVLPILIEGLDLVVDGFEHLLEKSLSLGVLAMKTSWGSAMGRVGSRCRVEGRGEVWLQR